MQVGQRGLLRDKHLRQMWGLPPLSGATVLPSHLLQTHLFLLFCPPANKFCHQPKLQKTSKRHPQHGIEFCGGLLGSGWVRVVHPGRWWLIISDYPKYPRTAQHTLPWETMDAHTSDTFPGGLARSLAGQTRAQFVPLRSIT